MRYHRHYSDEGSNGYRWQNMWEKILFTFPSDWASNRGDLNSSQMLNLVCINAE